MKRGGEGGRERGREEESWPAERGRESAREREKDIWVIKKKITEEDKLSCCVSAADFRV